MGIITELAILVLAAFVGFEVISKVPNTLHTPLMSGTNAIHGIVVLGGLLLMHESSGLLEHVLLVIAVMFGTINVIGGFLVTDRMLGMFKRKPDPVEGESAKADSIDSAEKAPGDPDSKGAEVESAKADSIDSAEKAAGDPDSKGAESGEAGSGGDAK